MGLPYQPTTLVTQGEWSDRLKSVVRDPRVLDKMGSADLKRAGKMLTMALNNMGWRAQYAEKDLKECQARLKELEDKEPVSQKELQAVLDRVTARNIELTGGRPPAWSYLYKEAVERLHEYVEFETKKTSKGFTVYGVAQDDSRAPLYDYDYAGLGMTQAQSAARLMTAHLRQCFSPREHGVN